MRVKNWVGAQGQSFRGQSQEHALVAMFLEAVGSRRSMSARCHTHEHQVATAGNDEVPN